MYLYLIIAVQSYCIYHAYKNSKPYYWYFLVFFIPVLGSVIYILTQVYNRNDVEKIQGEITSMINPTAKIKDLETKLEFSDTYSNRIALADAYVQNMDMPNAILNYNKTLEDTVQDDLYARQQLVLCYFHQKAFLDVITQAEAIQTKLGFKGSKQQFCYGLALKELDRLDEAEAQLRQMDRPYSNYAERLELAKFFLETNRQSEGEDLLNEIYAESQNMTTANKSLYRDTFNQVEKLLK